MLFININTKQSTTQVTARPNQTHLQKYYAPTSIISINTMKVCEL